MITPDLLVRAVGCTPALAAVYAGPLQFACWHFGITTRDRLAMFLAQIGHESGSLRHKRELWGPTAAQERYEGRKDLGNTQPGDGYRFRGNGPIQVTGRFNHAKLRDELRTWFEDCPDFEDDPEALEDPKWACLAAGAFWHRHDLNNAADRNDFLLVTRRINGGTNGLADRQRRWDQAKEALVGFEWQEQQVVAAPTPEPEPVAPPPPPEEKKMSTFEKVISSPLTKLILGAVNPILAAVPELVHIFTDKSTGQTVPERNVQAGLKVVEIAQKALASAGHSAPNAQAVAEQVSSNPEARAVVREALMSSYFEIVEAGGGGIDGARKADAAASANGKPWQSPVIWVTFMLIPLVYIALYAVLFREGFSNDIKAMVLGAIFGGLLTGGIQSFFYGTSASSQRKTDMIQK